MKKTQSEIEKLRADAEQGYADAQYFLDIACEYGIDVDEDQWSATQGHAGALEIIIEKIKQQSNKYRKPRNEKHKRGN